MPAAHARGGGRVSADWTTGSPERLPGSPADPIFSGYVCGQSLLDRLGLGRPELRAWAMYDWAASAVQTTIMVAVFPIYFVKVAGAGVPAGRRHPAAGDDQLRSRS